MDNNLEEQFEEVNDNPIDPEAVQLVDDAPEADVPGDDDATFGAPNPETPRQGEADGLFFLH